MKISSLKDIESSFHSYQKIIFFYEDHKNYFLDDIEVRLIKWFSANMSAVLGAILDLLIENINTIKFHHTDTGIRTILQKNGFLSYYGENATYDVNNTTIKYQKLKKNDGRYFKNYVIKELLGKSSFPHISEGLKEKMIEAIYEIFVNAQIHSESEFIYTCGQFYPQKNEIEFTIVDIGVGFKEKINRHFSVNLSAEKAIKWAVTDKNTTKSIPGGIGLAILNEFVSLNKGKIQIVSADGFYQFSNNRIVSSSFRGSFPGTIVNMQFKTDDEKNYYLKSEVQNINDIF